MSTNEKQQLSPAERRRRMEMRQRRQQEQKRRKRKKIIGIGVGAAAAVIMIAVGIWCILTLTGGGSAEIAAAGETFVIAIDPGHGGEDVGMSGASVYEKEIDLRICSKLKIMLESQGYQVVLTREEDTHLSKEERVTLANESGADLLVSVHCGYSEDDTALSGVRTSYRDGDKKSKALAENVEAAVVKETEAQDAGTQAGAYTILTEAEMPAVLVEAGYLSNEAEAANLAEDVYQNDVAKGIAKGIIASLKKD